MKKLYYRYYNLYFLNIGYGWESYYSPGYGMESIYVKRLSLLKKNKHRLFSIILDINKK